MQQPVRGSEARLRRAKIDAHPHALVWSVGLRNNHCNLCRAHPGEFWRCKQCDFDCCHRCLSQQASSGPPDPDLADFVVIDPAPIHAAPRLPAPLLVAPQPQHWPSERPGAIALLLPDASGFAAHDIRHPLAFTTLPRSSGVQQHACGRCKAHVVSCWRCSGCSFGLCSLCLSRHAHVELPQRCTLSATHRHELHFRLDLHRRCDHCEYTAANMNMGWWQCAPCNFDLCARCFHYAWLAQPRSQGAPTAAGPPSDPLSVGATPATDRGAASDVPAPATAAEETAQLELALRLSVLSAGAEPSSAELPPASAPSAGGSSSPSPQPRLGAADATPKMPDCIVCTERPVEIVFIPCGHLVCCRRCAEDIKQACPMCRQPFTLKQKVFADV